MWDPFWVLHNERNVKKWTSWSLSRPGVEVGLKPNIMKGINIFFFSIVGFFFFFFLTSKLDVQCIVIAKKEQTEFLVPM
jgi:hypothetical protein